MKALYRKIAQIMRNRTLRKRLRRYMSVIAVIVVFVTTYATVLPAITLEKTASCGIEEHQHSDDCYEEKLICGQEESDGHHHDDSCYTVTKELVCQEKEHQHSEENGCYDEEGNLICKLSEHVHDDSCYEEVETLTCGQEESEGHHHTDACYEKVLVCGKEAHTHGAECYGTTEETPEENTQSTSAEEIPENAADNSKASEAELTAEEAQPENYVPELDPVVLETMFGKYTGFYYYHPEEGEEVPESSTDITDWQELKDDTVLASEDLVRMYLPYTIPAESLNATNSIAQYRLPENIHLTDKQVEAINKNKNGFYNDIKDSDENADKYLGAEAIEGDRRPDEELNDGAQEYISAIVRVKESSHGSQDLIFTFVPYTVEKNQTVYDADKNPVSTGEKITGWFACDFTMDQIDWAEEERKKTAEIIFAAEDKEKDIEEISCTLTLAEDSAEAEKKEDDSVASHAEEFKSGTLTAGGKDYNVALEYTEDAKIPENAELSVHEITEKSDKNAYNDCLTQAEDHVAESGEKQTSVDKAATRFFDIEIIVKDEDGTTHKIEPAAPVSVRIQIPEAASDAVSSEAPKQDPTVLHFAEDGLETIDSTKVETSEGTNNSGAAFKNGQAEEILFETDSFSVYGVVYTVDFHWEVDGKEYAFSLPGGGFVSFTSLSEALGIAREASGENEKDSDSEANDLQTENRASLNDIEISELTKEFVSDVEKLTFSNPELVWVGKAENDSTVGGLKEANELECEYSAELTEEQIAEINAQTVKAGDWALISMHPFLSEESLTVTMKNGDQFVVRVTDAQDPYGLDGQNFEIIVNGNWALNPVSETERINGRDYNFLNIATPSSGSNLAWHFEFDQEAFDGHGGYYISHEGQYLKMVGTDENDTSRTVTLVSDKADATPINIVYDKAAGKYSFSNTTGSTGGYLCQFDTDYFGVAGSSENNANAWMELRNPDNYTVPGFVSPWDVLGDNIKIKLFDYTGTVNGSDINEKWASGPGCPSAQNYRDGSGVNKGRTLLFTGSGRDVTSDPYNYFTGQSPAVMQGIVSNHLGDDGYPELTDTVGTKGPSLGYLFGDGGQEGVTAYTGSDGNGLAGLLRKDENGYYYYSSEQNYATLVGNEIKIYSESYDKDNPSENARKIGFFPFDPYRKGQSKAGEEKGPNGSPYNHQFGMTMEATFVLPPDGKLPNGDDMQFNFSGDDDVWVFIDDVLVLDLGGVHQPLSGTINFAGDGYSSVTDAAVQTISGQTTVGNGKTLAELFEAAGEEYDDSSYSTHTIKFYYLERGGCDSNCTLSFNLLMYKTLTVAKELEGLTDEERAKYANNEFACDIFVNGELYNGSDTIRYDATGNVIEEGFEIANGKVNLKPGERVRIIGLQPNDTFYAAEENGLSMTEFYPPRAERFYQDQNKASHEEEVELTEEHEDQASDISDWRTQTYPVENLEELMFTNTLREKNLDVEKTWSDGADKHSGDEVKFKVAAKVKIDGQEYDYTDVISAMYSDTTVQNQKISDVLNTTYTLSAANDWKAQLEHLPGVNNKQQEIFYEIIEVQTANGYASTVTGTDSHNIDVVKIFPEDHTFEDEEIKFKLKKGTEYYNEGSKSWGPSGSATVYTLNADNSYTQRFHDFPAGDYSYEEVGNNEGNDNQQTDGLVVYDRALKKFDILNGPFNITVEKKWDPESLANEQVDGRKVEITLGRYILMDKKGNLTIRKEGVPEGADFKANYTVKNTETDEIFGIYPYVPGGIIIDVPEGSYTVTEEIIQDDDTYTHEHGENTTTVEIEDGGNASAVFTSAYSPIMGQMTIKSTLEANGTGVSFDDVKYEVYDTKGNKVKEYSFSQVTGEGKTFEIKTGSYVVREVNVPETPNLVAKFKPKKPENGDREIGVTVKQDGDPAKAEFKATYQQNKATVRVTITTGNPKEKTWTDFNVGDTIRITYKRNNSETINVPTVTGGTLLQTSPEQDEEPNGFNGYSGTYHVDIKITDKNVTAAFSNPGIGNGWSAMDMNSTTITLVSAAGTNSTTNSAGKRMLGAPQRASSETYKNIDLPAAGTEGTVPDAPEGSKYVEDTSFSYETITLNYGNWSKVLSDLPSVDANGNRYYYYIKSVQEENMPSLAEGSIKLDGDGNHLFVGSDNASTPLTVTNAIPKGSLEITKTIQKNGLVDTSATGTFYYAIYKEEYDAAASPAQTPVKTGNIQVTENGTNTVTVPDLYYGTYYVYELTGEGGTPIVSGAEGVRKVIADTVYQVTGSGTTAVVGESTPSVTLTNNKETVNVEVEKDWQDNNNAKGKRPLQLKVTLSNGTEVTLNSGNNWKAAVNDLPKYNSEGQLIVYTWTEETIGNGYTLIGTNIDSVTGADGTETQTTTLTNGPDEHYNPKTTFTGTKTWNDDGTIRPDEIVVILYKGEGAQKEEVERKTLEKKEDGSNEWAYEFTNIPVFDEQGNVIQYSVEEVLPNGYTCSLNTGTSSAPGYERDEANDQVFVNEPNADVRVSTGVNLGFVVIKHGNDFIIWTPRKATEAELTEIKNKIAAENNAVGDSEFSQILQRPHTNVYGVPSNDIRKGNMTASIYMDGDEVVVHFGNKNWSQLAWGQLAYTYTPGRTDLINTQNTTGLEFYKKWINSVGVESEWDKDIEVTVRRNGDTSFLLVYNLAKADIVDGKIISPTTNNDADPKIKVSVTENEGKKTYLFTIEGLDYANENNEKYTYTVTETNDQLEGYLAPTYSNTSAPTGAAAAYDKGTIINQQPGVELPTTGGPGTRLYTILGIMMITFGATMLLFRRQTH